MGIDLSPDGDTLVVADANGSKAKTWVHVIDLEAQTIATQAFPRAKGEAGTFAVAFANDGTVFITSRSRLGRSRTVPMRRYDPASGAWSVFLKGMPHDTMVSASADMSVTQARPRGDASPRP